LVAALTAKRIAHDEFHFVGFLPHKSGQRRNKLAAVEAIPGTLVLYESPYRIEKLLTELNEVFPDRRIVLARELSKKFEEFLRGTPQELLATAQKRTLKGEFVALIAVPKKRRSQSPTLATCAFSPNITAFFYHQHLIGKTHTMQNTQGKSTSPSVVFNHQLFACAFWDFGFKVAPFSSKDSVMRKLSLVL